MSTGGRYTKNISWSIDTKSISGEGKFYIKKESASAPAIVKCTGGHVGFDVIKESNSSGYIDGKEIEKKAADASKKLEKNFYTLKKMENYRKKYFDIL